MVTAIVVYLVGVGRTSRRALAMTMSVIVAFECLVVAFSYRNAGISQMLLPLFFAVVIPWLSVALFLSLVPVSRQALTAALGTPLVYVLGLLVGLAIGDISGLVTQ
jgi:hypothetical protein